MSEVPSAFTDPARLDKTAVEEGSRFAPRFDAAGLIACVTTDAVSGVVLMVAYMNAASLQATLSSGVATYWSRSRGLLWKKGETSGQIQRVVSLRTDCDQDALLLAVSVEGDGGCCHTGRHSCFYRTVLPAPNGGATLVQAELRSSAQI